MRKRGWALSKILKDNVMLDNDWELNGDCLDKLERVELANQPHILLQTEAIALGLDDVFLATSRFDALGKLKIEGVAGSAETVTAIEDMRLPPGKWGHASLKEVAVKDWPLGRTNLQAWLAGNSDPRFHFARADRVYAKFFEDFDETAKRKKFRVRLGVETSALEGVEGKTADAKDARWDAKVKFHVSTTWDDFTRKSWPDITGNPDTLVTHVDLSFEKVRDELQEAIAAKQEVDGTLIGKKARFNDRGELELSGICTSAASRKLTTEEITRFLRDKSPKKPGLPDRGVNTSGFALIDTAAVLRDLNEWVFNEKIDDVRVDRIYFDKAGELILMAMGPQGAKMAIDKRFEGLLAEHGILAKLKKSREEITVLRSPPPIEYVLATNQNELAKEANDPPRKLNYTPVGSLTAELRKYMSEHRRDPNWRGVVVRHGYFDRTDFNRPIYSLDVIVDRPAQKAALDKLVLEFTQKPAFASYLPKGVNPGIQTEVVPLDPMITRLRDVMPADPLFDHFRVEDAAHDDQGNLVLIVAGAGTPASLEPKNDEPDPVGQIRKRLKRMLDADSLWKQRSSLKKDSRLVLEYGNPNGPVPIDAEIAGLTSSYVVHNDLCKDLPEAPKVREMLRTALMHETGDSTLWYLSAVANFLDGKEVLAKRDLYRLAVIEKDHALDSPATEKRKARLKNLEALQGQSRVAVNELLKRAYRDVFADRPPLAMQTLR